MSKLEITKSPYLAEVEVSYKTKVKAADRPLLNDSQKCYGYLMDIWSGKIEYCEEFVIVMLNRANKSLGWVKISQGGVAGTVVDRKMILQPAILANASSIVISHNHPSGNKTPSQEDLRLTKEIQAACKFMDIKLVDHIIITFEGYYSFADEGVL
jgi:DNA repair protein RadC